MRNTSVVFWAALALVSPFVLWGAFAADSLSATADVAQGFVVDRFGWFYLLTVTGLLIAVVALAASRFGRVRLGSDAEEPEYGLGSWFAMLFSAGMGIGLVFFGVAEPVAHYLTPPTADPETTQAARDALRYSFFHWGLHPWAAYAALAMALAYARFRRGWKATISGALRPILGDRADGPLGAAVDTVAVVATVFGVAASLGFGAAQINGGLAFLIDGMDVAAGVQLAIIAVVTVLFLASAMTGLNRGIKWLSNANMVLGLGLFLFVLFTAPSGRLVGAFTTTLGAYITELPTMSLQTGPFDADRAEWINDWTVYYWAWWISWSPFVATFIARISRGRTIREFVVGALAVPTLLSGLWFSVFGGAGIFAQENGADLAAQPAETQLFALLDTLPGGIVAMIGAMILIATFFITSADSATFVLGSLTTKQGADPARPVSLVWGLGIAGSAAVLLVGGGLDGLRTISVVTAFPFSIVLILTLWALVRGLREENRARRLRPGEVVVVAGSTGGLEVTQAGAVQPAAPEGSVDVADDGLVRRRGESMT